MAPEAQRPRRKPQAAVHEPLRRLLRDEEDLPDLKHHTIILSDRYKQLLWDIFERKTLADDFSLYLHAPTRTDAAMAPPGHEAFYVLSPVPNDEGDTEWTDEKNDAYRNKILDFLDKTHLPGLRENLTVDFSMTRATSRGACAPTRPTPSGLSRAHPVRVLPLHNRSEDVDGLLVGAGCHPGAGMLVSSRARRSSRRSCRSRRA